MKKEKKSAQLIMRLTEKEKEFLIQKAEEENRTISAIVKMALSRQYENYAEIHKRKKEE